MTHQEPFQSEHNVTFRIHKPVGQPDVFQGVTVSVRVDPDWDPALGIQRPKTTWASSVTADTTMLEVRDKDTGDLIRTYPARFWTFCETLVDRMPHGD